MELDLKDRVRIVAGIVMTPLIAMIASSMVLNGMNRDFNGSPISILGILRDLSLQTEAQEIAAAIFVGVAALCIVFIGVMIYTSTTTRYGHGRISRGSRKCAGMALSRRWKRAV